MADSISLSGAKAIDMSKLQMFQASEEMMAKLRKSTSDMYTQAVPPPDGNYAQVKVAGKVVATVTNNGFVGSSSAFGGKIRSILDDDSGQGPALAERRARQIADALNGEVVKASTAQTQAQWNARPAVTWKLDYETMERHGHSVPPESRMARFASKSLASETVTALLDFGQARRMP